MSNVSATAFTKFVTGQEMYGRVLVIWAYLV